MDIFYFHQRNTAMGKEDCISLRNFGKLLSFENMNAIFLSNSLLTVK